MLTKEERKEKYEKAIEILTKWFAEFYEKMSEKQQDNLTENKILNFAQKEKFDLEIFGQQIQDIEKKAIDGETDLLKSYVLLKRIEAWVKAKVENLKDLAYNQYIDRGFNARDEIAFGYGFAVTTRKTINFKEDEEYSKINDELKKREDILKNAVNQSDKNNTVVDENGEIIQPPSYTLSQSLTIKKV